MLCIDAVFIYLLAIIIYCKCVSANKSLLLSLSHHLSFMFILFPVLFYVDHVDNYMS